MKVSVDEILNKYKQSLFGKEVVYFRANNPKYLIICFTAMHHDRFDRVSWFYENGVWEDTCYLFLQDNSFHYYLGSDTENDFSLYRRIIEHFFKQDKFLKRNTITLGSSMGGYAALYYAIEFAFGGAISAVPQLDRESANLHKFQNWVKFIFECGTQWKDMLDIIKEKEKLPLIYLEYGNYEADKQTAHKFLNELKEKSSFYISRKIDENEHAMLFERENIILIIDLFKNFNMYGA